MRAVLSVPAAFTAAAWVSRAARRLAVWASRAARIAAIRVSRAERTEALKASLAARRQATMAVLLEAVLPTPLFMLSAAEADNGITKAAARAMAVPIFIVLFNIISPYP